MANKVIMPKTGMAMEEGTLVRWLKKVGDTIARGEAIAVIETDKVTMDLESDCDGTLLSILCGDGTVVKATRAIAWIGAAGEQVPADAPESPVPSVSAPADTSAAADVQPAAAHRGAGGKVPATPAARVFAAKAGIALSSVAGSGPGGAVRLRDLPPAGSDAGAARADAAPLMSLPMTGMRRAIAEKMLRSHRDVPAVTLVTRADVTELAELREHMNAGGEGKVSWTDFIVRAAAAALREHPLLNSVIEGERIVPCPEINIGVAVALEAGLIVPVIRGADKRGVRQIGVAARDLAERARSGTLAPAECAGGTFTVTNLGMYGITEFTPLINVPESAILGVGSIEEAFRTGAGGGIESRKVMSLCLTHDHRSIDGAPAAAFLARIRALLENCWSLVG
jgi:pyruvate dehydrogenase E2 component (dihydrolipoamide acetyltransferase)